MNAYSVIAAMLIGAVMATSTPAFAAHHGNAESAKANSSTMLLFSGAWTKKSFASDGEWRIYQEHGKTFVALSGDFKTRNAPDLKIFLSPQNASTTTGKNATDGAVLIAPLTSNKGAQVYEIPATVDLENFKSILIHCEAYSKLWSAANLRETSD